MSIDRGTEHAWLDTDERKREFGSRAFKAVSNDRKASVQIQTEP